MAKPDGSIVISGSLSANDYLAAMRLHMRPRPLYYWLGIILCLLAVGVMLHQTIFIPLTLDNAWIPLAFLVGISLVGNYFFISLPKQVRRTYAQQKLLHENQLIQINSDFLITSTGQTYRKVKLDIFHNYKYNNRMVLLYQSEAVFNIFPRRWFSSDADYDLFVSYVKDRVKCEKKWQPRLA
jgi:hypothetical protein